MMRLLLYVFASTASNSRSISFCDIQSGVVHLTGGTTALFATLILGPRRGRFYDAGGEPLETPKPFPGHSVALQLLGTMILWFGCKWMHGLSIGNDCQFADFVFLPVHRVWIQSRIGSPFGR